MTTAMHQQNSGELQRAGLRFAMAARSSGMPRDQVERFTRAGYVPQPKQMEFHAAARSCDHERGPEQVALGGARGPGKSHAAFAQVALDDCQRFPGLKVLFLRKLAKAGKESFEDLRKKVLRYTPHEYHRGDGVVSFPENESRIIIGHFKDEKDVDNYLGIEYDVIVNEEASTLSLSKRIAVRGSLRSSKGWRTRIYDTTNPGGVGHAWFKATYVAPWRKRCEDLTRFIPATYRDNRYLEPGYIRYLNSLTGWLGRAWRDGDWDIAAGQFFTTWRHELVVVPASEMLLLPHWRKWGSLDYGFTHPTAIGLFAEGIDGEVLLVDEHVQSRWQVDQQCEAFEAMLARHGLVVRDLKGIYAGHDVFAQRGDSLGLTIADQYEEELGVALKKANVDRQNGAAEVLRLLGDPERQKPPKLRISDRCVKVIECLPMLEHDPDRPEDVLKVDIDEDGNGGDDPYDMLRYGLMNELRTPPKRKKKASSAPARVHRTEGMFQ